jgi:hypothetical protein
MRHPGEFSGRTVPRWGLCPAPSGRLGCCPLSMSFAPPGRQQPWHPRQTGCCVASSPSVISLRSRDAILKSGKLCHRRVERYASGEHGLGQVRGRQRLDYRNDFINRNPHRVLCHHRACPGPQPRFCQRPPHRIPVSDRRPPMRSCAAFSTRSGNSPAFTDVVVMQNMAREHAAIP